MRCINVDVTTQEVPGELSICFTIAGCPLRCKGCHSNFLWNGNNGDPLDEEKYSHLLTKYKSLATCVLFMGGEWHKPELIKRLAQAKSNGYKTCLYTGLMDVSPEIKQHLTWMKVGPWIAKKGGLDMVNTNQKFIDVKTNKVLNSLFTNKAIS